MNTLANRFCICNAFVKQSAQSSQILGFERMKKSAFGIVIGVVLALTAGLSVSCVKEVTLPNIFFRRQPVVVGLLSPDSLISLRLTYSLAPSDTGKYQSITNANVRFFENGLLIGELNNAQSGLYALNRKPTVGKQYAIKVRVEGYPEITAVDSVPVRPSLLLSKFASTSNPNQNPDLELSVRNIKSIHLGSVWFGVYAKQEYELFVPNVTYYGFSQLNVLSNSTYLDRFNAFFDNLSGKYIFGDPVRIATDLIASNPNLTVKFTHLNKAQTKYKDTYFMYAFTASAAYNKYLKSATNSQQNILYSNGELNNPFAEPTPIYSNITNGLGIWAGCSGVKIPF